jgi:hypothetical protein
MPTARHSAVANASVTAIWARLADLPAWPQLLHLPYADEFVILRNEGSGAEPPAPRSGEEPRPARPEALVGQGDYGSLDIASGAEFTMKGRRLPYRLFARITDWEPERLLAFEIHRSEYPSDRLTFDSAVITVALAPLEDGRTRVTCEHMLKHRGPIGGAYAATVMRPFLKANVQRIVDGLTAI